MRRRTAAGRYCNACRSFCCAPRQITALQSTSQYPDPTPFVVKFRAPWRSIVYGEGLSMKHLIWIALLAICLFPGCMVLEFWQRGSQAVHLDASKIGTGQQAFSPANSTRFADGEPFDYRSR